LSIVISIYFKKNVTKKKKGINALIYSSGRKEGEGRGRREKRVRE